MITIIAAVAANRAIGFENKLPRHPTQAHSNILLPTID